LDLFGDILQFFVNVLAPVSSYPNSAAFVVFVSVSLALVSSWATLRFSDVEKLQENMKEVQEWQKKANEARKTMDPYLLEEVQQSQGRIMRLQTEMMGNRMKPMCIYYIPFLIIFGILNTLYGATPVVVLPFNAQELLPFLVGFLGTPVNGLGFGLYFWPWYAMASFALGNLVRRALGVNAPGM
jgi:uncharacterized membrane protein (DUF106 family)